MCSHLCGSIVFAVLQSLGHYIETGTSATCNVRVWAKRDTAPQRHEHAAPPAVIPRRVLHHKLQKHQVHLQSTRCPSPLPFAGISPSMGPYLPLIARVWVAWWRKLRRRLTCKARTNLKQATARVIWTGEICGRVG